MGKEAQVISFFAPDKVEIPTTTYLPHNQVAWHLQVSTPTIEQLKNTVAATPDAKFI